MLVESRERCSEMLVEKKRGEAMDFLSLPDRVAELMSQAEAFARAGDPTAALSRARYAHELLRADAHGPAALDRSASLSVERYQEALRRWQAEAEQRQSLHEVRERAEAAARVAVAPGKHPKAA
jgi:hypothetical protein